MDAFLKKPRRKGSSNLKVNSPLPVLVESETGIPAHLAVWKSFSGRFIGDGVQVCDAEDISMLYNMGFFGKGLLSRGCPRSAKKVQCPEVIRERQWKRRRDWALGTAGSSSTLPIEGDKHPGSSGSKDTSEVVVIADTNDEGEDFVSHLRPRIESYKDSFPEVLNLLLEEAMFLAYGLGCLYVFDIHGQKVLNTSELWTLCTESNDQFIQRYVAYHHFRSKGWVVKSGLKFGGDFLLYKDGPSIYHASYIVVIEVVWGVNAVESCDLNKQNLNWITLMGLNRLAEASGKEVLYCYIIWPSGLLPNESASPNIIKKFKVHEVLIRRWQPSVARTDSSCNEVQEENLESIVN